MKSTYFYTAGLCISSLCTGKIIFNTKRTIKHIQEIGTRGAEPTHRVSSGQTSDADHESVSAMGQVLRLILRFFSFNITHFFVRNIKLFKYFQKKFTIRFNIK